ncbi:menaquinone biosynthesis protein [Paenibacillus crassostreae]|uniref:Chorismate dehydratase n=1 Tax=Paenibacillus crassostreae TaxID=1763538 RepID=A0A167DK09_9BACL|nr:menaquinone biosynthesis protein [Paenibacillus crassostreae]AOZ91370.1 ABC transporter substrate-binding protein [Paenibacillus crassostreae]OAB74471.1 ABC transporter substrate-binding protein [Paenibacillus crassostreae]
MGSQDNDKTVLGKIQYTNAWPIFYYFEPDSLHGTVEMITDVPSILNRGMGEGQIDIGALSSFAYGEISDSLLLLPDLSVSADGPVHSILLFSKVPLEYIINGRIAVTNTSASSTNLLKILMSKALEGNPEYITVDPDLSRMMEVADAALLIGDHAIKASWEDHGLYVTDLSELWNQWTGFSMTFAVWAVHRDAAENKPEVIREIVDALLASKRQSLSDLSPIVYEAMKTIGGTMKYWQRYFENLCYDYGARQRQGLELYFRYAYELGLISHEVTMELWQEKTRIQVKE